MQFKISVRGGRLTKWKGRVASIAPGLVAVAMAANALPAQAYDVNYTLDSTVGPSVSDALIVDGVNQQGTTGKLQAVVSDVTVSKTTLGGTSPLSSDVTDNSVTATVWGNSATKALDTSIDNATGAGSNAILASTMRNAGNDAFAAITSAQITNTADISTGSAIGLSDNSMDASVSLSKASYTLQGDVAVGFGNTDAGSFGVTDTTTGASAGLLIQSTQSASDVQNATAANSTSANTSFASITGSDVDLTITDAVGDGNTKASATVTNNTLAAEFTANNATNGIDVTADGMPTLSSTAGISSVQTAATVGIGGDVDAPVVLNSATIASDSGVGVTITGAMSTASVDVTANALTADATMNLADNKLVLESGMSLAGQSLYSGVNTDLGVATASAGAADLFVSNLQSTEDSNLAAAVYGADGVTVSAVNALSGSSLTSTFNTLSATADVNDATSMLRVEDANSMVGTVSSTNVQNLTDTTDFEDESQMQVAKASALVDGANLTLDAATTAGKTITNSQIALSSNDVTATTRLNASTQQTLLSGNILSSGQTVAGTGVNDVPKTTLDADGSTAETVALESGYSSGNLQVVNADSASTDPVLSSKVSGDGTSVVLTAGNATGSTTSAALEVSSNELSASGVANTSVQQTVVDATTLTASVAMGSLQSLSGSLLAENTGSGLKLATTGAASNSTFDADLNIVSAGVTGNLATNVTSVSAGQLVVQGAAVGASADASRTVLSSDMSGTTDTTVTSAAVALANSQLSTPAGGTGITSTVGGATVADSLSTGTLTATNTTLSADANQITSMARANTATNLLALDVGSVDMTEAFVNTEDGGDVGGTNLAALASTQENKSDVTSQIDPLGTATASGVTATMAAGTGAVSGSALSASSNRMTSLASGNSVTNQFELTATNLLTPDATGAEPTLNVSSSITASSAAIAVGNEQLNSGTITATIGAATTSNTLEASILGERTITGSSAAADSNRILAQAVAASGSTNTATIDATNIATSALAASTQTNSGSLDATVGDSTGNVKVLASLGADSTASTTSVSASSNLIGATATALKDDTSLRLGNADTAVLAGTQFDTTLASEIDSGVTVTADYAVAQRQSNSADADATVKNASVETVVNDFTNGSIISDANVLAAQSTGVTGSTSLSGQAAVIGSSADGLSNPVFALASQQANGGDITGTLANAGISMTAGDLGTTANGEDLSLSRNSLAATATGVSGSNQLSTVADAGASGLTMMTDASALQNGYQDNRIVADRVLLSDQSLTGAVGAYVTNGPLLSIETAAAAGSTIAMSSNSILGTATGIEGANTLTNGAGAANSVSAALAVSQDINAGANVTATVTQPEMLATAATVGGSSIMQEANAVTATAKGVTATNRLITSGGSIDPVDGDAELARTQAPADNSATVSSASSALILQQDVASTVSATLDAGGGDNGGEAAITADATGAVTASAMGVNGNQLGAVATMTEATNVLAELSDSSIDHTAGSGGIALVSDQIASGSALATVDGVDLSLSAGSTVDGSSLSVDGNAVQAAATGATASNRTALVAKSDLSGGIGSIGSASDEVTVEGVSSLLNRQTVSGVVTASFVPVAGADAGMAIDVTGAVTGSSSLSVSSNSLRSQSVGAQASNVATLQAGSITNASAALVNDQSSTATNSATLQAPSFAVSGAAVSGTVDISANRAVASSTSTSASNSLAINSDSLIDGKTIAGATVTLQTDAAGNLTDTGAPVAALLNRQTSSSTVTASVSSENEAPAYATLTGSLTGSLAVDSNVLVAQGRGNYADNNVTVSATAGIADGAQVLLASNQNRSGSILSTVDGASESGVALLGGSVNGVTGSLSIDNNVMRASGSANIAVNAMTIDTAGFTGSVSTGAVTPAATPAMATTAQFAVLNGQENSASVSAKVSDYTVGGSTGSLNGSASLNGNMFMADATGNSSISTLRLAAAGTGAIAPIALVNSQTNSGDMSAEVTGVKFSSTSGASTGSTSASGNSISASTTGNLSSSSVGASGSVFTSF